MPYREFIDVFVLINKSQQTPDKDENDWDENSWRALNEVFSSSTAATSSS